MSDEEKNIDSLIDDLSEDLKPVRKLWHPFLMISPWLIICMAYLAGVIHFLGIRMDIEEQLSDLAFVFEMSLVVTIALSAGYTAGWLAIPDMRGQKWMLSVSSTLFGVFLLWNISHIITSGMLIPEIHWHHCFSDAMLMGFVPVAVLSILVRKGTTTRPGWMAFMSSLSIGAMGWGAMRITCGAEHTGHLLLYHFFPYILIAVILGVLARKIYNW